MHEGMYGQPRGLPDGCTYPVEGPVYYVEQAGLVENNGMLYEYPNQRVLYPAESNAEFAYADGGVTSGLYTEPHQIFGRRVINDAYGNEYLWS